jgi:hypothetical protein
MAVAFKAVARASRASSAAARGTSAAVIARSQDRMAAPTKGCNKGPIDRDPLDAGKVDRALLGGAWYECCDECYAPLPDGALYP